MEEHDATSEATTTITRALKARGANPFRVGLALGALIAVAVSLLIAQNGESAQLDWLAFHFSSPLWIMLLLTLISGGVVWELLKTAWRRGRRNQRERREALKAAKNLPI